MSYNPKNHVRGKCSRCGNDTDRHWRALYCWPCQALAREENDKRVIQKRKEMKDNAK